ncbi:hypothetical protein [Gimesia maris]|mgnify:CR=1 FL=1|uniref:hypothetical protein n=1 Tax=Gimesia maris TaxID=122 RepID=UPI0030D6D530|tara:strand:- start:173087 stop:173959 length:873 start_codon:yes stop_codon:yes gene_type:complete
MTLSSLIKSDILSRIAPRTKHTNNVLARLKKYESTDKQKALNDEEVWTLLLVYGYAVCGKKSLLDLANVLTGTKQESVTKSWLEMKPMPPRKGVSGKSERNSQIDLLVGDITKRSKTKGGVKYKSKPREDDGWACFVEAKWLSDIAVKTTHDWERNQLARVIETALTFQGDGQWPSRVYVTLLTPAIFKTPRESSASRLYAYKWWEYVNEDGNINLEAIRTDIDRSRVAARTDTKGWTYPDDLDERLGHLSMNWVTYEDLLSAMPKSDYYSALCNFVAQETKLLQKHEVA